ncbi:MAG: hypothetical protein AB7I18_07945 [Candidatus Berkiella sp.]
MMVAGGVNALKELNLELVEAAKVGDAAKIRGLINNGAEVNFVDDDKRSAISYALENEDEETVFELLQSGASLSIREVGKNVVFLNNHAAFYSDDFLLKLKETSNQILSNLRDPGRALLFNMLNDGIDGVIQSRKIKKYSHILGLSDQEEYAAYNKGKLEGNNAYKSLIYLTDLMSEYYYSLDDNADDKDYFAFMHECFTFCQSLINDYNFNYQSDAAEKFYQRYEEGDMTFISTGFEKHAVGVTVFGYSLVYCNRGDGTLDEHAGTKIYKLKNPIDVEFFNKCIECKNREKSTAIDLHNILQEVVDLDNPIVSLPSKAQEHGNCSFANPKSSIEAMLLLYENGENGDESLKILAEQKSRECYKSFTRFIRDNMAFELVEKANNASTDADINLYIGLIKKVLQQHTGQGARTVDKMFSEIARVQILLGITDKMRHAVLTDDVVQYQLFSLFNYLNNMLDNEVLSNMLQTIQKTIPQYHLLKFAIESGDSGFVEKLLAMNVVDVLEQNPTDGKTPLEYAKKSNNPKMVQIVADAVKEQDRKMLALIRQEGHYWLEGTESDVTKHLKDEPVGTRLFHKADNNAYAMSFIKPDGQVKTMIAHSTAAVEKMAKSKNFKLQHIEYEFTHYKPAQRQRRPLPVLPHRSSHTQTSPLPLNRLGAMTNELNKATALMWKLQTVDAITFFIVHEPYESSTKAKVRCHELNQKGLKSEVIEVNQKFVIRVNEQDALTFIKTQKPTTTTAIKPPRNFSK